MRKLKPTAAIARPKLSAEALAEVRALRARVRDAQQKVGEIDMQIANLEVLRQQARVACAREMQAMQEAGAKHVAAMGLDVSQPIGITDDGEVIRP
jgi:hypothetical protein